MGCAGGGGSGGDSGGSSVGTPHPLAGSQPASNFLTGEFNANYGLGLINAEDAYARGAYGGGVIVAVADTGVDATHPDLNDNISPASTNIANPGGSIADGTGHGTAVAGVVAAEKNNSGMHGVAFNATILALRIDNNCVNIASCVLFETEIAAAIDYAVANQAHVVNLSLGGLTPPTSVLETAMELAADAGVIMVAATGNDTATQPIYPARNATDADMHGVLVAVGSVDSLKNLAADSNHCGSAANFCLVAPGVSIVTTGVGGGLVSASGTSFATPHVAGAIALIIQRFPNLSRSQVVQILLTTAEDLGAVGVDTVFGHGLVNLDAAILPVGSLIVPLSGSAAGGGALAKATRLTLGRAFGNALQDLPALAEAIGVDSFNRAYGVDLSESIGGIERDFGLEALLAPSESEILTPELPFGLSMGIGLDKEEKADFGFPEEFEPAYELGSLLLSSGLGENSALSLGYSVAPGQQFDLGPDNRSGSGLFWSSSEVLSPHHGLFEEGSGASLDLAMTGGTSLNLGWFQEAGSELWDREGNSLGQVSLDHRFDFGAGLRLGTSYVAEQEGFLGSETSGAFGEQTGAESLFVTLSGSLPLTGQIELIGSFTHGTTRIDQQSSALLSDWSAVSSTAFGAGVVARNVFAGQDRLGFLVGQPLRVYDASARSTVPTAVQADNSVVYDRRRVDATPSGREIDLQLAYDISFLPGLGLSNWVMMQLEPGHDDRAAPGYAAGLKLEVAF